MHLHSHVHRICIAGIKGASHKLRYSLQVNDAMAMRKLDIAEALFDKNLGLGDGETSSDNDEDEKIHDYLGSSFFTSSGSCKLDLVLAQDKDFSIGSKAEASHHKDMLLTYFKFCHRE